MDEADPRAKLEPFQALISALEDDPAAVVAVAAATERREHPAPDDLAPFTCNEI